MKALFHQFQTQEFTKLIDRKRSEWINRVLLEFIQSEPEPCFLLPQVLEFVKKVEELKLLQHYTLNSFELWLNQYSKLSFEENCKIRGKIAGKLIPRREYQDLFPVGTGKIYEGSHFVCAHRSPDLDTTIASFWGWLDAFAAHVSSGLHIWNLPGEPSQVEIDLLFRESLGAAVLTHLPKNRIALVCTGNDLMTQEKVIRKTLDESIASIQHDRDRYAVIVVNAEGFYVGDWRAVDAEEVGQVILLLETCLRWFENALIVRLAALFKKESVSINEIKSLLSSLFTLKISECDPARDFTVNQKRDLENLLSHILHIKESSFEDLELSGIDSFFIRLEKAKLFDHDKLTEQRAPIFHFIETTVKLLHEEIVRIRAKLECFDTALTIKQKVFGHHPTFITVRTDVEEIRAKMAAYSHLTVVYPDEGNFYPVGVVRATDVRKTFLGTVSIRDFSNHEETTIPPYLEIISVIDHHKTTLTTYAPSLALIGDVQSCNTLTAECAMQINDRNSLGGMTLEEIDQQLKQKGNSLCVQQRLLMRKYNAERDTSSFIHPERESLEYLHFLCAILDDSDLLTKVTMRDVKVCLSLLNRLCSLKLKREVEVLSSDELFKDSSKEAAQKLLQTKEMYAIYRKTYEHREENLDRAILLAAQEQPSNLFLDTKEQNGCCRVGQTKFFSKNIALFEKHADAIRSYWIKQAMVANKQHPELDLHLHMVSTISSAEEVFKGTVHHPKNHRDELWFWIPTSELAVEHLKNFLNAFQTVLGKNHEPMDLEFLGPNGEELSGIFKESFIEIPHHFPTKKNPHLPIAILRYRAGTLNSRKAMISPYLPFFNKS